MDCKTLPSCGVALIRASRRALTSPRNARPRKWTQLPNNPLTHRRYLAPAALDRRLATATRRSGLSHREGPKGYTERKEASARRMSALFTLPGASSAVFAVAVLVLLAAAAGTILVAADLAPACGIVGIAIGGSGLGHQRGTGERHLVFAGIRIELVRLHRRQRLLLFRRHDLDAHQLRGHRLAQMRGHRLIQAEGFRLVFLQRI